MPTVVPQTDPHASYDALRADIDAAVRRVLESGWYILGQEVEAFEGEFAAFAGVRHGVGVANGTDALALALRALGIGPGDAVVTVSHTAVATVAAIEMAGALPVLVDVDEAHGMDPDAVEALLDGTAALPARVRAILPVHLYGQPVRMKRLLEVARRHGLAVVEDCSQAHGATIDGQPVGSFGDLAAFSLYPTKNLGAFGDGGITVSNDEGLIGRVRELRQYGWRERYVSASVGVNSRLDELQAAILRVKLPHLASDNQRRREIAAAYDDGFAGLDLRCPVRRPGCSPVFHQYVIDVDQRAAVRQGLADRGVMTGIHYPVPVHRQPAYAGRLPLGPGGLPRTERFAGSILSLPMHPYLTDEQVARVIKAVQAVAPGGGRA